MKRRPDGPEPFPPDLWTAFGATIILVSGVLLEAILAGVLLFLVSGGGYDSTVEGRQRVAVGASLWLLVTVPVIIAVLWGCWETARGRRRGMVALIVLCTASLVSGVVMMSAVVGVASGIILLFCVARLAGYGPRPT